MSSDEDYYPDSSSSQQKYKRARKTSMIPLESGQRCIAKAMTRIVNHMVNKELQQRCKELLEMGDMAETEARILFILQQIDKEREVVEQVKKENKIKRIKKRLEIESEEED